MFDIYKLYNIKPYKVYGTNKLYEVLVDLGITNMQKKSFTTDWVIRKIKEKSLILPPRNERRYKFTGRQIKGIVESFVPGGRGIYNWKEHATDNDETKRGQ